MDLGTRILMYRAKHRITQDEFAKEVGLGIITVHRAEKNQVSPKTKAIIELYLDEKGEV